MFKKAQMQIGFNWIFVLIAGAVILLFFVGIVVKQQQVSEENLARDIVGTMDSIFTAARVSDKTKNVIPLRGLEKEILLFSCEDSVTEFSLKDQPFREQNNIDPLFSPNEIKSSELFLISLPYNLPYKTLDFLMLTSPSVKYVLIGKKDLPFVEEFLNQTEGFNVKYLPEAKYAKLDITRELQLKIIDLEGGLIVEGAKVPGIFDVLADKNVRAVSFSGNQITYYQREGDSWASMHQEPLPLISVGGERDAAKYAAIFAHDDLNYWCNMQKAFNRISFVDEIYRQKIKEMLLYYDKTKSSSCASDTKSLSKSLEVHQGQADICERDSCSGFVEESKKIRETNQFLKECEIQLY